MSVFYFKKELVSNSCVVSGKRVPFEPLDGNRGVIQLNSDTDKATVEGLMHLASQHRAGIVQVTQAEYESLKKKHPISAQSVRKPKEFLRAVPTVPERNRENAAADKGLPPELVSAPPVEALAEPTPRSATRPTTARVGKRTGKLAAAMQSQLGT